MKVKFNVVAQVYIDQITIDAESKEDAEKQLEKMDLNELATSGYLNDFILQDVSGMVVHEKLSVHCSDITYDVTEDDLFGEFEGKTVQDVIDSLPTEKDIDIELDDPEKLDDSDIKSAITDELTNIIGYIVSDCEYTIKVS